MMEKRVLLAFVLSIAVVWAFQGLFMPAPPVTPPAAPVSVPATPAPPAPAVVPPASPQAPASPETSDIAAAGPEDATVDTTLFRAVLSNTGGVLKSFQLKAYTDAEGKAIELVSQTAAATLGWPLGIVTGDATLDATLAQANFAVQTEGTEVRFEFAGNGVRAEKTLRFDPLNYQLTADTSVTNNGQNMPHRIVWRGGFGDQSIPPDPATAFGVIGTDAKFERIGVTSVEGVMERSTTIAGVEDRYFLAAFILPQPATVQLTKLDYTPPVADADVVSTVSVAAPVLDQPVRIYIGPKDDNWLAMADPRLGPVVDYGYFEVITRPLLVALLWIHSYVGNFGWAIIILTIALNTALFPLRLKQQVSMQKMSKLQPQMRTLQDRYKKLKANDPRRAEVQSEMMNLYKQNGVNPMGGCLPLLLQMPLLFAFWNMLSVSIEMRRAPWILWLKDLSQYDPYFIIPILMAVSMIVSTKMMPTTVDPAQAKMMMIMPVLLTVMFLWLQSGVTLYYLTSNVVGIGQQWFIKKYWSGEDENPKPRRGSKNKAIE